MTPRVVIFFLRGLLGRMEDNLRYITELYQCVGKLGAYTRTCYFWWVKWCFEPEDFLLGVKTIVMCGDSPNSPNLIELQQVTSHPPEQMRRLVCGVSQMAMAAMACEFSELDVTVVDVHGCFGDVHGFFWDVHGCPGDVFLASWTLRCVLPSFLCVWLWSDVFCTQGMQRRDSGQRQGQHRLWLRKGLAMGLKLAGHFCGRMILSHSQMAL